MSYLPSTVPYPHNHPMPNSQNTFLVAPVRVVFSVLPSSPKASPALNPFVFRLFGLSIDPFQDASRITDSHHNNTLGSLTLVFSASCFSHVSPCLLPILMTLQSVLAPVLALFFSFLVPNPCPRPFRHRRVPNHPSAVILPPMFPFVSFLGSFAIISALTCVHRPVVLRTITFARVCDNGASPSYNASEIAMMSNLQKFFPVAARTRGEFELAQHRPCVEPRRLDTVVGQHGPHLMHHEDRCLLLGGALENPWDVPLGQLSRYFRHPQDQERFGPDVLFADSVNSVPPWTAGGGGSRKLWKWRACTRQNITELIANQPVYPDLSFESLLDDASRSECPRAQSELHP